MLAAVIMFAGAAAFGGWSTWHRLGRTRAARRWANGRDLKMYFFPSTPYSVLVGRPLLAIALAAGGVLRLAPSGSGLQIVAGLVFLVTMAAVLAYGFIRPGIRRIPRWAMPAWYRAREPSDRG